MDVLVSVNFLILQRIKSNVDPMESLNSGFIVLSVFGIIIGNKVLIQQYQIT